MIGARLLAGVIIGGALVYFYDPQLGPQRRARLQAWWEQSRGSMQGMTMEAATGARAKAEEAAAGGQG